MKYPNDKYLLVWTMPSGGHLNQTLTGDFILAKEIFSSVCRHQNVPAWLIDITNGDVIKYEEGT